MRSSNSAVGKRRVCSDAEWSNGISEAGNIRATLLTRNEELTSCPLYRAAVLG